MIMILLFILPLTIILWFITLRETKSFSILEHVLSLVPNVIDRHQPKKRNKEYDQNNNVILNFTKV